MIAFIKPEELPILTILPALLLQVPPNAEFESVAVDPLQRELVPVIVAGLPFTVNAKLAALPQPVE